MSLKEKKENAKKLTPEEKDDIRRYYDYGWTKLYLAYRYKIPYSAVKKIVNFNPRTLHGV